MLLEINSLTSTGIDIFRCTGCKIWIISISDDDNFSLILILIHPLHEKQSIGYLSWCLLISKCFLNF